MPNGKFRGKNKAESGQRGGLCVLFFSYEMAFVPEIRREGGSGRDCLGKEETGSTQTLRGGAWLASESFSGRGTWLSYEVLGKCPESSLA